MPWQERSPMDLRLQLVRDWQSGVYTMTELCADYQISPKTGYKWIARYDASGRSGLEDRSRRPHTNPRATAKELVAQLIALRQRHPHWGAPKLLTIAARQQPAAAWPKRTTVCDLLKREGLVRARRRTQRLAGAALPLAPVTAPNQTWTVDFKGRFLTGDGRYCYPLTLRDAFSRFVLRCDALLGGTSAATRQRLERAFAEYGLPERIRSDNGVPFASAGWGRLSPLSVWWMRLGIAPERIAPGRPDQNGSHEQFHAVLKAETTRPPAGDARAQQRRFVRFRREYNAERPHAALANDVPASIYRPSPRSLPRQLPPLDYPGHFEVRRVSCIGQVSWWGEPLFLSVALVGQDVAFEEVDDGLWTIRLGTVAIGRYDRRRRKLLPIAPLSTGRFASCAGSAPDKKPNAQ
jgi:transposase InsO family protein